LTAFFDAPSLSSVYRVNQMWGFNSSKAFRKWVGEPYITLFLVA